MAKSQGSRRKKGKRVAQHIKQAANKIKAKETEGGRGLSSPALASPLGVGKPKRKREIAPPPIDRGRCERDRTEASAYLQAWWSTRKTTEKETGAEIGATPWKFNKNTQAWLLRNMFSEAEVDECSFRRLCVYLEGLQGGSRQRLIVRAQELIESHAPLDASDSGGQNASGSGGGAGEGGQEEVGIEDSQQAEDGVERKSFSFSFLSGHVAGSNEEKLGKSDGDDAGNEGGGNIIMKKPRKDVQGVEEVGGGLAVKDLRALVYNRALKVAEVLA